MFDFRAGTPYIFSLLNGSELIAKVDTQKSTESMLFLENAMQFTMQRGPDEQVSVGLTLAAHFGEPDQKGQSIVIPMTAIALIYSPQENIAQDYSTRTNSLVLPK